MDAGHFASLERRRDAIEESYISGNIDKVAFLLKLSEIGFNHEWLIDRLVDLEPERKRRGRAQS